MTTPKVRFKEEQKQNPIIGDELHGKFFEWVNKGDAWGSSLTVMFCQWLTSTGDGDLALRRLNDWPRQLFLPFPDEERPWEVVDE